MSTKHASDRTKSSTTSTEESLDGSDSPDLAVVQWVQKKLIQRTRSNIDREDFIPSSVLGTLLPKEKIVILLRYFQVGENDRNPDHYRSNVAQDVCKDALDIFAILFMLEQCQLITAFTRRTCDMRRLPVGKDFLLNIGIPLEIADRFLRKQYLFVDTRIPFGSVLPKEIDDFHILRFVRYGTHALSAKGAFGIVTDFCLYNEHGTEEEGAANSDRDINRKQFVRKQFHSENVSASKDYLSELRNLTILAAANHPNVVPLIAAYTHKKKHNLIFPLAPQGTLEGVLSGHTVPSWLPSDSPMSDKYSAPTNFLVALSDFCSALHCVHNLNEDMLHSIGCHRDLKPSNILIDEGKLILADFGLAKMTGDYSTSQSIQPVNRGDYLAPECQDMYDDNFEFKKVGRAADIWSFGCVLLQLLVLRSEGVKDVAAFDKGREVTISGIKRYRFHTQHDVVPAVTKRLENLKDVEKGAIVCEALRPMIKSMLSIDPLDRPKASTVMIHLQRTTLAQLISAVREQFIDVLRVTKDSTHIQVEQEKFRGWQVAVQLDVVDPNPWAPPAGAPELSLQDFHKLVEQLRRICDAFGGEPRNNKSIHLQALRHEIDLMLGDLSDVQKQKANDFTERALLDDRGEKYLETMEHIQQYEGGANTIALASLKLASERKVRVHPNELSRSAIPFDEILRQKHARDQLYLVKVENAKEDVAKLAIAEERKPSPTQNRAGKESLHYFRDRVQRLQSVAQLLQKAHATPSLHTLPCSGFYYDELKLYSGLIYDFPVEQSQPLRSLTTLHELFKSSPQGLALPLGQRFALACTLTISLYELHKVSWMHRRISASNVVYFHNQDPNKILDNITTNNFYFIGFAQSRQVSQLSDTDGHTSADEDVDAYYQHPTYRDNTHDFQSVFDYYALGILLLEIGHRKLLPSLCSSSGTSVKAATRDGFRSLVAELSYTCGDEYRRAVEACVGLEIGKMRNGRTLRADEGSVVERNFREKVLRRLVGCRVAGI